MPHEILASNVALRSRLVWDAPAHKLENNHEKAESTPWLSRRRRLARKKLLLYRPRHKSQKVVFNAAHRFLLPRAYARTSKARNHVSEGREGKAWEGKNEVVAGTLPTDTDYCFVLDQWLDLCAAQHVLHTGATPPHAILKLDERNRLIRP